MRLSNQATSSCIDLIYLLYSYIVRNMSLRGSKALQKSTRFEAHEERYRSSGPDTSRLTT